MGRTAAEAVALAVTEGLAVADALGTSVDAAKNGTDKRDGSGTSSNACIIGLPNCGTADTMHVRQHTGMHDAKKERIRTRGRGEQDAEEDEGLEEHPGGEKGRTEEDHLHLGRCLCFVRGPKEDVKEDRLKGGLGEVAVDTKAKCAGETRAQHTSILYALRCIQGGS